MTTNDFRRSSITSKDVTQSWLEWSGPERPGACSVLILHGLLQNAAGMSFLAHHLSRYHRVVVPDLRGRGETTCTSNDYTPATIAADLARLVEHLGLERVVVVGRTDGGVAGYHLAAKRPDLVRGLVLAEVMPEVDTARAERRLAVIRSIPPSFANEDEAVAWSMTVVGANESRARHDIPYDTEPREGRLYWRYDLGIIERIDRAAGPRADWDLLATITAPTLILRGQRGRLPVAMAQRTHETIARSQLMNVLGSNHDVFLGAGSEQALGALDMFLMRLNTE